MKLLLMYLVLTPQNTLQKQKYMQMNMDYKNISPITFFFIISCIVAMFFKLSFMLGSYTTYFGFASQLFPLAGILFTTTPVILFLSGITLLKWLTIGTITTLKIPTTMATAAWLLTTAKKNWLSKLATLLLFVVFPFTCMTIFILHPIAGLAPLYACYWLIPAIIYGIKHLRPLPIFFTALQITFIAHATGAIIWLFTIPMTPKQWNSLILLVAIERVTFALITTIFLKLLVQLQKKSLGWLKFITFLKGIIHENFNI